MTEFKNEYEKHRSNIKTGDIVLFSGDAMLSRIFRFIGKSRWSHVGVVMCLEETPMRLCYESVILADGIDDYNAKKPRGGVRVVTLSERIADYAGEVAIRHLNKPVTKSMSENFYRLREESRGKSYNFDFVELAMSAFDADWTRENREDLSSYFCSELVAEAYQRMNLVDEDKPSNEYVPGDFENISSLNNDYQLGEIVPIKTMIDRD